MATSRNVLPSALTGDRRALSDAAKLEVAQLSGARWGKFTLQLLAAWAVILASAYLATRAQSVAASAIAILVIATRQNVLGLLVHEQAHLLGYRRKYGDVLVNLFAAYPLLVLTVEDYAQVHLAHHRDYFTEEDPDFLRKSGTEWEFPKSHWQMAKLFLRDVTGVNTLRLARGKRRAASSRIAFARRHPTPRWVRPAYFLVGATLLTLTHTWIPFLVYWCLPILTVTQLIVRWGAICEHKYNLPGASVIESTPLILLTWWERLLLPNLNFAMHPYHHFFPGVSFSKLPDVHRIFCRERLVDQRNVFHGYFQYYRSLTTRQAG